MEETNMRAINIKWDVDGDLDEFSDMMEVPNI